ncbi:MAG TPA: N-acetylmuramoyl-L-alanine amidase [Syntrophomonadaceae bacterium]|nr:N-acetylmuramoyl-L-alanine amidase [Syntrophomonadaceae bacterium]HPR94575.1 N-acetylmuramoyl-L-alanine amidase [Syntrophomonadaceae bacterium]
MNILDYKLSFGTLTDRRQTNRIIIHHSASEDVSAQEIHRWHLDQGWSGIGYHFVIRKNGTIERGRPVDKIGAHAGSEANSDSIGICLTGNFVSRAPEIKQIEVLLSLIEYLEDYYKKTLRIMRHSDVYATVCPGTMFPWPLALAGNDSGDWKQQLIQRAITEKLISSPHNPDDQAEKWFVLAVALNLLDKVRREAAGDH